MSLYVIGLSFSNPPQNVICRVQVYNGVTTPSAGLDSAEYFITDRKTFERPLPQTKHLQKSVIRFQAGKWNVSQFTEVIISKKSEDWV